MHCVNERQNCSRVFYATPSLQEFEEAIANGDRDDFCLVPECSVCGAAMKPHCMFFDESYSEHYYRSESVYTYCQQEADCLIVVGTALQTGLASRVVGEF